MVFGEENPPLTPNEREIKSAQIVRENLRPVAPREMDCDAKDIMWMAIRSMQKTIAAMGAQLEELKRAERRREDARKGGLAKAANAEQRAEN